MFPSFQNYVNFVHHYFDCHKHVLELAFQLYVSDLLDLELKLVHRILMIEDQHLYGYDGNAHQKLLARLLLMGLVFIGRWSDCNVGASLNMHRIGHPCELGIEH